MKYSLFACSYVLLFYKYKNKKTHLDHHIVGHTFRITEITLKNKKFTNIILYAY